ncbi:unnamed protein product [Echinostoma caproni]|uniref:Transposase n=1 Tax=Echinostoma caproni TaxID=27848 RepID=A0A183B5R9_9TREM|nr:unnamed protein product [Echinostoma caproni]
MADRVYADQLSVQSITQPAPSSDNAELVACVKALVAQVQALTLPRDGPRQRRRPNHRSRSPRRHRSRSPLFAGITADTVMPQRGVSHRAPTPPGRETSWPTGPGDDRVQVPYFSSPIDTPGYASWLTQAHKSASYALVPLTSIVSLP